MIHAVSLRTALFTTPRLLVMAVAIAVGLTIAGGAALVAAQRGEPGEPPSAASYQGCVNTYTGVLRIVTEGEQCADHEMPIQLGSSGGDAALLERVELLEEDNTAQQAKIDELELENADRLQEISDLEGELSMLEDAHTALQAQVPACLSTSGTEVYFEGCNVNIRSGSGATEGTTNSLGNLIIGYNETDGSDTRTGSHNLVIGPSHSYSSFGGLVAGRNNEISGDFSTVRGGQDNIASGLWSSVSGGYRNIASDRHSSVSGGFQNTASSQYSSVSSGSNNIASGSHSSVRSGQDNIASGDFSSVNGGTFNTASGDGSSVSGGQDNIASGPASSVSGGSDNTASVFASAVGGGSGQDADATFEFLP